MEPLWYGKGNEQERSLGKRDKNGIRKTGVFISEGISSWGK